MAQAGVAITDLELRMTIKTLAAKGRSRQRRHAEACREGIDHWVAGHGDLSNLAALHVWLVAEHDYGGSLRSVQRFVSEAYRKQLAT